MTFPSDILSLARSVVGQAGAIYELEGDLHVNGAIPDHDVDAWKRIMTAVPRAGVAGITVSDDIVGPLGPQTEWPDDLSNIRISIAKQPEARRARFFTAAGAARFFHEGERFEGVSAVCVAEGIEEFRTQGCRFVRWTDEDGPAIVSDDHEPIAPFCRTLSSNAAPRDMRPWLIIGDLPPASDLFAAWRSVAAVRLAASLASEVWSVSHERRLTLNGPRKRTLAVEDGASPSAARAFGLLSEAANWVYDEPREAEVRHALLVSEIARDWPGDELFFAGFAAVGVEALSSARMGYRLHVQGTTERTLKVLGELRKNLSDDVNRISQQSRDLVSGLWRDLTVAMTAVIGRVLLMLGDKPAADSPFVRLMLAGTAVFIAVSAGATLYANQRFAALAKDSLLLWRNKLYGFMDDQEMQRFALTPLAAARSVYQRLVIPVIVLYVLTVVGLGSFALHKTHSDTLTREDMSAAGDSTPIARGGAAPLAGHRPSTQTKFGR